MSGVALSPQLTVSIHGDFETITGRLRAALKAGGFTILHQTSIGEMTAHGDYVALHPSVIIGVYYPDFVYRAYVTTPTSALLLPYTFMVSQIGDDQVEISLLDPRTLFDLLGNTYLKPIAQELFDLATRILDALEGR